MRKLRPEDKKNCQVGHCKGVYKAKGYCTKHYAQIRLYGKILKVTKFTKNKIELSGNNAFIIIEDKDKGIVKVTIDKASVGKAREHKWFLTGSNKNYVGTSINKKITLLHRLLLDLPNARQPEVDHINRNSLDNRLINLRLCTSSENKLNTGISNRNTSGYKGVTYHKKGNLWQAQFRGKYLGIFKDKEQANARYLQEVSK